MPFKPQPLTSFRITVGGQETQLVARDLSPLKRMACLDLHGATLDYDQAMRLRNWLSDWLGQHGNPQIKTILG
jgi:hypothetical protein